MQLRISALPYWNNTFGARGLEAFFEFLFSFVRKFVHSSYFNDWTIKIISLHDIVYASVCPLVTSSHSNVLDIDPILLWGFCIDYFT